MEAICEQDCNSRYWVQQQGTTDTPRGQLDVTKDKENRRSAQYSREIACDQIDTAGHWETSLQGTTFGQISWQQPKVRDQIGS